MALRRGHLECGGNYWPDAVTNAQHVYEIRPRKDHRGVNLISAALPFGRLWYGEPNTNQTRKVSQPLTSRCGSDLR
jgi:hypothetical protein